MLFTAGVRKLLVMRAGSGNRSVTFSAFLFYTLPTSGFRQDLPALSPPPPPATPVPALACPPHPLPSISIVTFIVTGSADSVYLAT